MKETENQIFYLSIYVFAEAFYVQSFCGWSDGRKTKWGRGSGPFQDSYQGILQKCVTFET